MEVLRMQTTGKLTLQDVAYHRNGSGREGFHVVTFREGQDPMVAVVFEGEGRVAVFNRQMLGDGVIAFGVNSYRGDAFTPFLRAAITAYQNRSIPW
jgi:hypothetical protein